MTLDSLQRLIEKLQKTIEAHRGYLAARETRTRQLLIDPLLRKLRWNISNPNIVQLEYPVRKRRPDYALMSKGKPLAVVEAKKLGTDLDDDPIMQVLAYALAGGIPYAILTDGDKWEMYDVFKRAPLEESLLMQLELSQQPAHKNALQALAMRKPNLTAKKPDFKPPKPPRGKTPVPLPIDQQKDTDNWCSFEEKMYPLYTDPTKVEIDNRQPETVKGWKDVIHTVAVWLANEKILSVKDCPIEVGKWTFISTEAMNRDGTPFKDPRQLPNGFILQRGPLNSQRQWRKLKQLLEDLDVDRSTIQVSYEPTGKANH